MAHLDGKKISPSDLAGKSGEVKIVYNYNNTAKNRRWTVCSISCFLTGMVFG